MAEVVRMPKLSDTMTEGVVSRWLKKVGDTVKSGDILAEIDSDKATMEFESFYDGVLLYIGVEDKKGAPVDSVLAVIGKAGEDITGLLAAAATPAEAPVKAEAKVAPTNAPPVANAGATMPISSQSAAPKTGPTNTSSTSTAKHNSANNAQLSTNATGRVKASPLAKKLAQELGLQVNRLQGSGDGGRIIKRDIENYQGASYAAPSVESYTEVSVSQMRKTIARRLAESKFTAPHFYLTMEINMDETIKARQVINSVNETKISFNDFVIKAVAGALRKHPKVNASWLEDVIRYNNHIHIGVAVAVEDGLLVPVVRFADGKTLSQIGTEVKTFAQKAKDKKLQPADWEGNTFTISNLGMFGIDEFTAIINPPDACILAVGGIKETVVVKNGAMQVGNIMKVTLSCDHRIVDGATGAAFLQTFKQLLENPVLLLGASSI